MPKARVRKQAQAPKTEAPKTEPSKRGRPKGSGRPARPLTEEEVEKVLAVAAQNGGGTTSRDFALVATLFLTGMRVGECVSLPWKTVAPEGLVLDSFVLDKHSTKGKTARRVYVNSRLKGILQGYLDRQCPKHTGWLFAGYKRHLNKAYGSQLVKALLKAAGIEEVSHCARKSFATRLCVERGSSVVVVQALLGHKHLSSTQRYVVANELQLSGAVETL